jgi:hypothetical protein
MHVCFFSELVCLWINDHIMDIIVHLLAIKFCKNIVWSQFYICYQGRDIVL